MKIVLNILFVAMVSMAIMLCAWCRKKAWLNLTVVKEQESRILSRTKLGMIHPDSAVIAGLVHAWQAVCDADSFLMINGRFD